MSKHNFDREITKWGEFIEDCKQRANDDEKELQQKYGNEVEIKCGYMRSPEICPRPSYLLLGMEPPPTEELTKFEICYFPLFLRYCIYKHLCKEKFDFHITDLAKGSMSLNPIKTAAKKEMQNYRYQKWLPLFAKEWELLGKPKIIVMGKELYNKFYDVNFFSNIKGIEDIRKNIHAWVYHYSPINKYIEEEYDCIKTKFPELDFYQPNETTIKDIIDFAEKFRDHLDTERHNQPDNDINAPLGEEKHKPHNMKVFAVYRYHFEQFNSNPTHQQQEFQ